MGKPTRPSPEVRERAVRMVFEHEREHTSHWATIVSIAGKIGCASQRLCGGIWASRTSPPLGASGFWIILRKLVSDLLNEPALELFRCLSQVLYFLLAHRTGLIVHERVSFPSRPVELHRVPTYGRREEILENPEGPGVPSGR